MIASMCYDVRVSLRQRKAGEEVSDNHKAVRCDWVGDKWLIFKDEGKGVKMGNLTIDRFMIFDLRRWGLSGKVWKNCIKFGKKLKGFWI